MAIIRPIRFEDLDVFTNFAFTATAGITSLPKNQELLKQKIEKSLFSFDADLSFPKDESYLFVLENLENKSVSGVSGICSKSGVEEPKYYYQIETIDKEALGLPIPREMAILKPTHLSNGPTEIGSLFLDPFVRKEGYGRLLSLSRFLFAACFPQRFDPVIIANMRGFSDKGEAVPFWEDFGRCFVDLEFLDLMKLLEKGKSFIPYILPEYPVYVSLLTKKAQESIGKVHENTKPAFNMLMQEGFTRSDYIDVFDGGPMITAPCKEIRAIKESRLAKIHEIVKEEVLSPLFIICNNRLDFKACYGTLEIDSDFNAIIPFSIAKALHLKKGDIFRYVDASPRKLKEP